MADPNESYQNDFQVHYKNKLIRASKARIEGNTMSLRDHPWYGLYSDHTKCQISKADSVAKASLLILVSKVLRRHH